MRSVGSSTRFGGLPPQRGWYQLQAAALSLLMLAFSIGVSGAQASSNPKPHDHVYLLRGFANVFSLGMDQIATKLEHQGIDTTVTNYVSWPTLAEEAAAEYKSGRVRTIILVDERVAADEINLGLAITSLSDADAGTAKNLIANMAAIADEIKEDASAY